MHHLGRGTFAGLVASALLIGCSAATTYSFELATTSSWSPTGSYVRVQVSGGRVVAAAAPDGEPAPVSPPPTIDEIWNRILDARARGELNSARFDRHGVPIESDMGPWLVDGGVHYSVRGFTKR